MDYLLTAREEDDEELKPSATLWNLEAHLCYCVSVFFSSVVPHGASQQPAGRPTRLGDKAEERLML